MLATKVGKLSTRAGLSAANIAAAVDDSLRRLKTDYIDVYFSHYDDETTPLDETLDAYQTLIKAGKVRVIGASNYTGERLEEALKVAKDSGLPAYQILQPEYNDTTPATVALAWMIARPSVTAPIASATSVAQLSWPARGSWQWRGVLVTSRPNREMCPISCLRR
ncbi:aldo/keto reductase [Burkholderia sp. SJ98]|nr:aldo/keto reductase [Burkholderia sp. SJ98]